MTLDELRKRVHEKLLENGAAPTLADLVIKPGFFATGDEGLIVLARALGVFGDEEAVS